MWAGAWAFAYRCTSWVLSSEENRVELMKHHYDASSDCSQVKLGHTIGFRDSGPLASTNLRSQNPWGWTPKFKASYFILVTSYTVGIIYGWVLYSDILFPNNWLDVDYFWIVPQHHLSLKNWPSDPWAIFLCLGSSQLRVIALVKEGN